MRYGFYLPTRGPTATRDGILDLAREGERLGLHSAKIMASLDILSGGRLTLSVGADWLKEEFEALNSPAFNARSAVTDEWITIFKQLWSQSPASFDGRFYRYSDIRCEPFPVQKPHPPIWVGGHSRA